MTRGTHTDGVPDSPWTGAERNQTLAMSVDPTQSVLQAAMRGAELRQTVLTNNLANADTPGYEPQDVDFQSQLSSAMSSGTSLDNLSFQTTTDASAAVGPNGNGVNADQQSANLAENGLLYDSLAEILAAHNSILEYAMGTK
jgi:flagellar basal-body rod protein FlgB